MALMSHSGIVGWVLRTISRYTSLKSCWVHTQVNNDRDEFYRRERAAHLQGILTRHAQSNRSHNGLIQAPENLSRSILQQILYVISVAALLFIATLISTNAMAADEVHPPGGSHDGVKVEQPIEFPHNIHVKDNKINCMYCHTYARRSKVAGIPPTSKCIGCHKVIATDKPRIQKLTQYWENKEPPRWKKVHDVPDFVHFTHEKHLKKFVFDRDFPVENVKEVCAFCHGQLENMTVANKVKPLNMGWCKNCHEANGGPGDCWKCHK